MTVVNLLLEFWGTEGRIWRGGTAIEPTVTNHRSLMPFQNSTSLLPLPILYALIFVFAVLLCSVVVSPLDESYQHNRPCCHSDHWPAFQSIPLYDCIVVLLCSVVLSPLDESYQHNRPCCHSDHWPAFQSIPLFDCIVFVALYFILFYCFCFVLNCFFFIFCDF